MDFRFDVLGCYLLVVSFCAMTSCFGLIIFAFLVLRLLDGLCLQIAAVVGLVVSVLYA